MTIFPIAIGAALLTLGRRLFWLFVGGLGFMAGLRLAGSLLNDAPIWLSVGLGLLLGLVGAAVAIFLKRFGIAVVGFVAGVFLSVGLIDVIASSAGAWVWIAYVAGGIIGAVLLSLVFDWSLIILSSLAGGMLIVQALDLAALWSGLLFFALFLAGIGLQAGVFGWHRREQPSPEG
jgi:hypothetical protein